MTRILCHTLDIGMTREILVIVTDDPEAVRAAIANLVDQDHSTDHVYYSTKD